MAEGNDIRKNGSGYSDPTAYEAIKNCEKSKKCNKSKELLRFEKLLDTIFNICELSGYHLESRIVVTDKETGRVWR